MGVALVNPKYQFTSSTGSPLANGTVTVYAAGTTTPTNTWQDEGLTVLNTNPITLDSRGEAVIWADPAVTYKFLLKNSGGSQQWVVDNIKGAEPATLRALLAASSGSSLVGFLQAGAGATIRTAQSKMRDVVSSKDAGATGDAATNDTANVQTVATNRGAVYFPPSTGYSITSLTAPANSSMSGEGRKSPVNVSGTGGVSVTGSNVSLRHLRLDAPNSQQVIYAGASASDVTLLGLDVERSSTDADGHGVQVNSASSNNWKLLGSKVDVYRFGYLLNTTAGGSKGHIVSGNHIRCQVGDPVEINSPSTAAEDVVVGGNVLEVAAGSGVEKGFGVGLAHVDGAAVFGNVLPRSWLHAIHIEDGSKNISVVGNIAKDCQSHGAAVILGGVGGNQAQAKAVAIGLNQFEADAIVAGKAGVYIVFDANGTLYGCTIQGNVLRNFESGLWLGGNASHLADGNVIDSCTYAIQCELGTGVYTRIRGTNIVMGTATALLYVSSGTGAMVHAGRFVCNTKPTNIILKAAPGVTRPGCTVEGFSWPQNQLLTAGAQTWTDLCPAAATSRINGRVTITARDIASIANNTFYTANISWDGTTLTISSAVVESNGTIAVVGAPALRVNGGMLQHGWFSAVAPTLRADVDFDGIYMA
jgi:hypothetical protein